MAHTKLNPPKEAQMTDFNLPTNDEALDPAENLTPEEQAAFVPPDELGIDPGQVITIRSSSGASQFVLAPEAMSLSEAINRSGLAIVGAYNVYMDGAEITGETLVPPGATVTIIGAVKGA